jgi:glycerol-3-phosphate acyltransferase PlsY
MVDFFLAVSAYFIGCIPSAYLFGRLFARRDIRDIGSGNVGAVNTMRHIGRLPGLLTLFADVAKSAFIVWLSVRLGTLFFLPVLSATLAILGHNYNLFLKCRGGKGLACLVGALLVLCPLNILILFGFIGLLGLVIRGAYAATGIGIFALPVLLYIETKDIVLSLSSLPACLLIFSRHMNDFKTYIDKHRGQRKNAESKP